MLFSRRTGIGIGTLPADAGVSRQRPRPGSYDALTVALREPSPMRRQPGANRLHTGSELRCPDRDVEAIVIRRTRKDLTCSQSGHVSARWQVPH